MREVVKSVDCNCGKIEIFFPSLSKKEIDLMVEFLYTGKISNLSANESVVSEVLDNLTKLLGFPNCLQSTKGKPIFMNETKTVRNVFHEMDSVSIKQSLASKSADHKPCPESQEELNQKHEHKNITDIISYKEEVKDQYKNSSMNFLTTTSFKKQIGFDENMELFESIEFEEKVELDEFHEKVEFHENMELDGIKQEDTIDALDDLPNILEMRSIIQEKVLIKFEQLDAANDSNTKPKDGLKESIDMKEIHEEVNVESETKSADLFDLFENSAYDKDQLKVEIEGRILKTYSRKPQELTANPKSHKHTLKWANQNSNSCPVIREDQIPTIFDKITLDEFLNQPKKDFTGNSSQKIIKIDEKARMVESEKKFAKIKENCEIDASNFKCASCEFSYPNKNDLIIHIKEKHVSISPLHNDSSNDYQVNQTSNLCPLIREKKLPITFDKVTLNEFLNNPKKYSHGNSVQKTIKTDKKPAQIKENDEVKNIEKNENELKNSSIQYEEEPLLNSPKHSSNCEVSDDKETVGNKTLEFHENSAIGSKNRECKYCFKTFVKYSTLHRHLLTKRCKNVSKTLQTKINSKRLESAETFYQCSKCKMSFSKESHLIQHQKERHEIIKKKGIKKMFKCMYCEKIIVNRFELTRHFQMTCTSDPNRFELILQMRIEDETDLKEEERKIALAKIYKCKYCNITFVRGAGLRRHLHQVCTSDPNRFELVPQMKIENATIPQFQCKKCEKSFSSEDRRNKHYSVHDKNRKKYDCSLCDKTFVTKQSVDNHISSIHKGIKPHLCSQCGYSCADKGILKNHIIRVHEGKRLYPCDQCNKTFKSKQEVKNHISSFHENIRPFQCTLCSRSFFTKDQLKDHGDVHTNIRPYSCTICEDKFKRSHHLVTHLKTIHNVAKKDWKI